jgi:signal transduction histidine kinase
MTEEDSQRAYGGQVERPIGRWLRPLGVATIVVVVALSSREHPSPALHGDGLVVTVALSVLVASIAGILWRPGWRPGVTLAPLTMIAASSALMWVQNGGPGIAGVFVGVSYAAIRLPLDRSAAMLGIAIVTSGAASAHAGRSAAIIISSALGVVAFYVLAIVARRLKEAHEQTITLLGRLEASRRTEEEAAALRERSRIAREIHDVLAHSLSGLILQLEGARMLARTPSADGELPAALDRAHHLARAGLEEARRAVGTLRDDGLPGADGLGRLAEDFSRDSGIETELEVAGGQRRLDSQASLTLFRVAQEALTNSRKHSQPRRVELRLAYEPEGTRLIVQDHDRRGAVREPAGDAPGERRTGITGDGYGLTGMRERAALLGGQLEAGPTTDGFRVELWIPS